MGIYCNSHTTQGPYMLCIHKVLLSFELACKLYNFNSHSSLPPKSWLKIKSIISWKLVNVGVNTPCSQEDGPKLNSQQLGDLTWLIRLQAYYIKKNQLCPPLGAPLASTRHVILPYCTSQNKKSYAEFPYILYCSIMLHVNYLTVAK